MRLKDNNNPFIHVNPPYQLMVCLLYPSVCQTRRGHDYVVMNR